MAHTFSYSVLTATPDVRRGERVNVGIAVFLPERVDIRLSDVAKLRALTGSDWSAYAGETEKQLQEIYRVGDLADAFIARASLLGSAIQLSEPGWLAIPSVAAYEQRVSEVLEALVRRPRTERRERSTRINTQVAQHLKKANVLAAAEEKDLENKVIRDFYVSKEEDLKADFALASGAVVVVTLDLRKSHPDIKEAGYKGIVLDKARKIYGDGKGRYGLYAAPAGTLNGRGASLELLRDYSTKTYNWLDPQEKTAFSRVVYDAINKRIF